MFLSYDIRYISHAQFPLDNPPRLRSAKIMICRSLLSSPLRKLIPGSARKLLNSALTEAQWVCGHKGTRDVLLEALVLAAKAGKASICRMILACGPFDARPLAEACGSALRFPAMLGNEAIFQLLIVEVRRGHPKAGLHEMRALCHAAQQANIQVLQLLMESETTLT